MRLFTYKIARDYGFAPNPFGGFCTLATCKPDIRQRANVGDWVAGIASKIDTSSPRFVFVMRVDEVLTYDSYWSDPRFQHKKPTRMGSVKQLFGDNIYHRNNTKNWVQVDSHHSLENGTPNYRNISNDTKSEGVLVSAHYAYWGSNAVSIPQEFLNHDDENLMLNRGYRCRFSDDFIRAFVQWFEKIPDRGFLGNPFRWQRKNAKWSRPR